MAPESSQLLLMAAANSSESFSEVTLNCIYRSGEEWDVTWQATQPRTTRRAQAQPAGTRTNFIFPFFFLGEGKTEGLKGLRFPGNFVPYR